MATQAVPCRVCGKAFVPCNKPSSALGAFNYRAVACSPECGAEYLRRVQEARGQTVSSPAPDAAVSTGAEETAVAENAVAVPVVEEQEDEPIFTERLSRKQRKAMKHGADADNM